MTSHAKLCQCGMGVKETLLQNGIYYKGNFPFIVGRCCYSYANLSNYIMLASSISRSIYYSPNSYAKPNANGSNGFVCHQLLKGPPHPLHPGHVTSKRFYPFPLVDFTLHMLNNQLHQRKMTFVQTRPIFDNH